MKHFCFLTIFPEQISFYLNKSIPLKAQEKNKAHIQVINIRKKNNEQVDDYAFGGKTGMVLMLSPILNRLKEHKLLDEHIILLTARGKAFTQEKAKSLLNINKKLVFVCGHYEGIDERISSFVSEEISIGDFLISSGELASLIVADAVIRLIPGVINPVSLVSESFEDFLLDYPVYTRPASLPEGLVPEVLLSGDHQKIEEYRFNERIRITKEKRPDLYEKYLNLKEKK